MLLNALIHEVLEQCRRHPLIEVAWTHGSRRVQGIPLLHKSVYLLLTLLRGGILALGRLQLGIEGEESRVRVGRLR